LQLERIVAVFFKVNVLAMLLDAVRQDALFRCRNRWPLSLKMFFRLSVGCFISVLSLRNFYGYIDIVIALARLMPRSPAREL